MGIRQTNKISLCNSVSWTIYSGREALQQIVKVLHHLTDRSSSACINEVQQATHNANVEKSNMKPIP